MIDWRIYYDNGFAFDSCMGEPYQAPGLGVVAITSKDLTVKKGFRTIHRWDFYYWSGDEWWGSDLQGVLYQFTNDRDNKRSALKMGVMVSNEDYEAIKLKATTDPDFPATQVTHSSDKPTVHKGMTE